MRTMNRDLEFNFGRLDTRTRTELNTLVYKGTEVRDMKTVYRYLGLVPAWDFLQEVGGVQAPTLVVSGAEDRLTLPEYGKKVAERIRDSDFVVVEDHGHYIPIFATDRFVALLREWLAKTFEDLV